MESASSSTITIILSSGIVSLIVTLLTLAFTLGKYKQKVDTLETDKTSLIAHANEFRTEIATLKEFKVQAQKFIDKLIRAKGSSNINQ
ncbi:MAG: hypothetical protein ACYCQI_12540 [Gammaproteobacteria bacterium]